MKTLWVLTLLLTLAHSQTVLVGSKTIQGVADSSANGQAEAFRKAAAVAGTVNSLTIYVDSSNTATSMKLGLYAGTTTKPTTLLTTGTIVSPVPNAWNAVVVSPVSVIKGTNYWLAVLGTNGQPGFRDTNGCATSQSSSQTNLTSFPGTWTSGPVWNSCNISMYGSNSTPPPITVTVSPSTATVTQGGSQQYSAVVGNSSNQLVIWSIKTGAGSIDGTGKYVAPNNAETDTVQAQSQADLTKTGTATATVTNVTSHSVSLAWTDSDVVTFNVYRGTVSGGPYVLLASGIVPKNFIDTTVTSGQIDYYVVTAVSSGGSESAYSNQVQAVIP